MKPEEYQRVKEYFDQARVLAPEGRAGFLDAEVQEPEVRREVESLLAVYDESPGFLEKPAAAPAAPSLAGRMLGPWRLVEEVGRGGMGVVWEAQRADGAYEQRAAVKLLSTAGASRSSVARFREERRILALLEHPSIARLLDGGAAEDGTPYLVMEFVEGQPLDEWLEQRAPALRDRLRLFLRVCEAVEYAHRRLVIHRDIKPGNVLVTADGSPKLLDFGIARLLEAEPQSTGGTERILTPGFASPEQVRGEPAGTASDVYSLGVLLYFLLTGKRPFGQDAHSPFEALKAVLEQDPPAPSAAAGVAGRGLRGELDAVVLLAMRKNPDERYASVHALAEDIQAWLDGRPVTAHAESRRRRAIKFVKRNRAASLAAALAALSILSASAFSIWQAQVAHRERVRAENGFREVRQFSRAVLLELNDAIRNLPGSTPARLLLLRRATEMLDNLARSSSNDRALQIELAEGYRRVGHIQGSSFSDNLGQVGEAIKSFRKAVRVGESAGDSTVLLDAYEDLADALLLTEPLQADAIYERHRALLGRLDQASGKDDKTRFAIAAGYSALGYHSIQRNRFDEAKADFQQAIGRFEQLSASGGSVADLGAQHAFALKRLGAILIQQNSLEQAETLYSRALAIENAGLASNPGDRRRIIDRSMTLSDLALIQKKRNHLDAAAKSYQEVVRVRREALDADPRNRRLLNMTTGAELNLASVYAQAERHGEAVDLARSALRRREDALREGLYVEWEVAAARIALAYQLAGAAEHAPQPQRGMWAAEADACLRRAVPVMARATARNRTPLQQAAWDQMASTRQQLNRLAR